MQQVGQRMLVMHVFRRAHAALRPAVLAIPAMCSFIPKTAINVPRAGMEPGVVDNHL